MKACLFHHWWPPPKEATYIDDLDSRRIQSQLYAKDGTYVNAYADGTSEMGVEDYPQRDELVTGPVEKKVTRYQPC
jgi:hypothetical protein